MAKRRLTRRFRLPWLVGAPPAPRPEVETQPPTTIGIIEPTTTTTPAQPSLTPQAQPAPARTESQPSSPARVASQTRVASQPTSPSRVPTQTQTTSQAPPQSPQTRATPRTESQSSSPSQLATQPRIASQLASPLRVPIQSQDASQPPQTTLPSPQTRAAPRTESQPSSPSRLATQSQVSSQPASPSSAATTQPQAASQPPLPSRGTPQRRATSQPSTPSQAPSQTQPPLPIAQPRSPSHLASQAPPSSIEPPPSVSQQEPQSQVPQPNAEITIEIVEDGQNQTPTHTISQPSEMEKQSSEVLGPIASAAAASQPSSPSRAPSQTQLPLPTATQPQSPSRLASQPPPSSIEPPPPVSQQEPQSQVPQPKAKIPIETIEDGQNQTISQSNELEKQSSELSGPIASVVTVSQPSSPSRAPSQTQLPLPPVTQPQSQSRLASQPPLSSIEPPPPVSQQEPQSQVPQPKAKITIETIEGGQNQTISQPNEMEKQSSELSGLIASAAEATPKAPTTTQRLDSSIVDSVPKTLPESNRITERTKEEKEVVKEAQVEQKQSEKQEIHGTNETIATSNRNGKVEQKQSEKQEIHGTNETVATSNRNGNHTKTTISHMDDKIVDSVPKTLPESNRKPEETKEEKEVVKAANKEQPSIASHVEQKHPEKQEIRGTNKTVATSNHNGNHTKTAISHLDDKNTVSESRQKPATSYGARAPLHREIREDISKFVQKMSTGETRPNMDTKPVSVIIIAGENKGASMELSSESAKWDERVHIHRGYKTNQDESAEAITNGEGSSRSKDTEAEEDQTSKAYVNSNIQGINNSIMFNSSITEKD